MQSPSKTHLPCAHPLKMTLVTFSPFSKFAYIDANSLLVIIIVIIIITNCVVYVCRKWKKDGTQRIMVSRLTGAALWRMQLTVPYNTQVGAVPYQMIMKQCISSTFLFAVHWLSFSWHFFIASNSDYLNRNAFLCYCLDNNNNNNKLRCLCLTEMKTDRTQRIVVSSLTGAAIWRMQLTFPYNTQFGAVPYRMIMKQCISSTFYSQFTSLAVFLLAFLYC